MAILKMSKLPTQKSYTLPSRSKANRTSQNLSKSMLFQRYKQDEKETASVQQGLKNIGVLVMNWKFRASIENRQTKILIMQKEKYLAWLSAKLKGQSFKLPYDFLAGSLAVMEERPSKQ